MSLVQCIKAKFPHAVAARCKERGCELGLRGLKSRVVLRGEKLCQRRRISDCLIFANAGCLIIVIAELKSRTIRATRVVEKLANGSRAAMDVLKACSHTASAEALHHVVLARSWSTSEYRVITSKRVTVGGRKYDITAGRCGASFSDVMSTLK